MAPTSTAHHLLQTLICQGTTRVCPLKTALLHVPLIFALHTFCPVGRDPHMTPFFSMMPIKPISTSQGIGITLQILALPCQMRCLSLIKTCGTICRNGIMPIMRKWVLLIKVLTNISSKSTQPQGTVQSVSCISSQCHQVDLWGPQAAF